MEISRIVTFPADRTGDKINPTVFGRNLVLLRRLRIGFSVEFAEGVKDPGHPLSLFLSKIDLSRDLQNNAAESPALWLTELSYKFDAFYLREKNDDPALRIIAEDLHVPVRNRRFVLHFRQLLKPSAG